MTYPSKIKILLYRFSKSKVYIILPICFVICLASLYFFIDAGQNLTPYSVHVRGYNRSDGTYVSSYQRRPPGGVAHDEPYESTRALCTIIIILSSSIGVFSIYLFVKDKDVEIIGNLRKEIYSKIKEELNFQINLPDKPENLINRRISRYPNIYKTYYCFICKKPIGYGEFHYSDLKQKNPKKLCLNCLSNYLPTQQLHRFNEYLDKFTEERHRLHEIYKEKYKKYTKSKIDNYDEINGYFFEIAKKYHLNKYNNS
jgi:hypothetical protein